MARKVNLLLEGLLVLEDGALRCLWAACVDRLWSSSTRCLDLITAGALCSFIFNRFILGYIAAFALLETRVIAHIGRFCTTAFCFNFK